MSNRNTKQIGCDRYGRPIAPKDVSPEAALRRAAIILPVGAALLPAGLLTYSLVELPESVSGLLIIFGFMIFFGALMLMYGLMLLILGLRARSKEMPRDEQIADVKANGKCAYATVTSVRETRRKGRRTVRVSAEYYDEAYRYKRRFVSDGTEAPAPAVGEKVRVWYHPDSNLGYYVEVQ